MEDHRLPKRVTSGEFENTGKRGPDCVADDRRFFGIRGDWNIAAHDPGAWYSTAREGGCRFMAAWVKEEERRPYTGRGREKRKRQTRLRLRLG